MSTRNGVARAGRRQKGAVAIIVGLSLAVLIGFVGLALDLGRLYVNKTELQSAADACALAAAAELVCDPGASGVTCPLSYLQNAEAAGIFAAGRNQRDFQRNAASIAPADVRFFTAIGPNSRFQPRTAANPDSRFAMCIARSNGIVPWFMGVLGIAASDVAATAVATLAKGQSFCNALPVGICTKPGSSAPSFGFSEGEWIESKFTSSGDKEGLAGGFKWVDFTPKAGGNSEIRDQVAGSATACDIRLGNDVAQPGQQQGVKAAYNTRFGIYPKGANAYTPDTAPPDRSGYAYPNKVPGFPVISRNTSAYADFLKRQAGNTAFIDAQYDNASAGGKIGGDPVAGDTLGSKGQERRLVAVPFIECGSGTTPILGMACVLMLNPMSNGANGDIYLEYRGLATAAGSPCRSFGIPGGGGSSGPLVPTLVQ